jgi:hypothetical protein
MHQVERMSHIQTGPSAKSPYSHITPEYAARVFSAEEIIRLRRVAFNDAGKGNKGK